MMNNGIIFTIFPLYTNETLLFTLTQIGILMGFREAGFVISVVSMGALSDRIGRRPIWLFGLISGAIFVVLLNYTSSFILLAFILACIGLSTGAFWVASPIIASESVETGQGDVAIGVYKTFFDIGSMAGPIIFTFLMAWKGVTTCFFLASALLIVNFFIATQLRKT
jgi:MFS family permease